jgi:hypothetical protein
MKCIPQVYPARRVYRGHSCRFNIVGWVEGSLKLAIVAFLTGDLL